MNWWFDMSFGRDWVYYNLASDLQWIRNVKKGEEDVNGSEKSLVRKSDVKSREE